jgi:transposase
VKGVIIEMDIYAEIRSRHLNGESQRSIASSLGISRQSVKKYCQGDTHPDERKSYNRFPMVITKEVQAFILSCFEEDRTENLKKQKHTAKRIYDRLVSEKSFTGGSSTVRAAVNALRQTVYTPAQCDIPLSFEPGEAIQIDWGECTVYLDGERTKLNFFCGRLCYSCDIFVQVYKSANLESFLEAQLKMFNYFNGIPRRIIFDNAKVAVKDGFGLHAKPQDKYLSFSAHYAFTHDFCNPAKGNEKGLVENLVGYARRNFMVPVPRVKSIEDLNNSLIQSCLAYRTEHKIATRNNPVSVMYHEELQVLNPIPRYSFDTSRSKVAKVDDFSTVRYEKNNYSVPTQYLRKDITIKGYANQVYLLHNGTEIASYTRCYEKNQTKYQLEHYIDLIERKPRSVLNAKPVKETLTRELLDWGRLLPGGNKEMVKLLRLCVDYGEEKILGIKRKIPSQIIPTVDMVRTYLDEPFKPSIIYLNNEIDVTTVNLTKYDEKYGVLS